jgi:hypothetical protein
MEEMMSLQAAVSLSAQLTPVSITHQTGNPEILIQASWILILRSTQIWIIQPGDIYLHILNHDVTNRHGEPLDHSKHLLYVCLD